MIKGVAWGPGEYGLQRVARGTWTLQWSSCNLDTCATRRGLTTIAKSKVHALATDHGTQPSTDTSTTS